MAKSKRKYSINVTAIICAVIIAVSGVLITLVGVGSSWFTNPVIASWFGSWGKVAEAETYTLLAPQEAGVFVLSTRAAKNAPVALSGESTQADGKNTCTLTATLEPANAYYSSVTWTATDNSGDISSHIELTQDENDPLTVTVKLNGELFYTEQITVEVVSLKTLTATCNVDYLAYPDSVTANITPATQYLKCNETYTIGGNFNYETTAGTIHEYDCVITDVAIELTTDTIAAISAELGVYPGWDYSFEDASETITLLASPAAMFYGGTKTADEFNRAFFKVCNGRNDVVKLRINCKFVYGNVTYTSVSGESLIGIDSASYAIGLDGVNIGDIFFTD